MSAPLNSGVYEGVVVHTRLKPVRHRLRYNVFSLLLDLDELARLDQGLKRFSVGRFNLFGFREADHGPKPREAGGFPGLKPWVEGVLKEAGIAHGGRVLLLCYPRILGYVFNPLSVFFCHDAEERLTAVIYEVSNTFGGRHSYVIPVRAVEGGVVRQEADKKLEVSPFMEMDQRYHFRIRPPGLDEGGAVMIGIHQTDEAGPILNAVFSGERREITDAELARLARAHPLMTLKIMGAIHWEAWKLWRKGLRLVSGDVPKEPITVVR